MEILSEVFPYFVYVNKQFKIPRLFQNRSESNSNDSKHFFFPLHYFKKRSSVKGLGFNGPSLPPHPAALGPVNPSDTLVVPLHGAAWRWRTPSPLSFWPWRKPAWPLLVVVRRGPTSSSPPSTAWIWHGWARAPPPPAAATRPPPLPPSAWWLPLLSR